VAGDIERCTAKEKALGQGVPENLTDAQDFGRWHAVKYSVSGRQRPPQVDSEPAPRVLS
jgi:hypothetical protein